MQYLDDVPNESLENTTRHIKVYWEQVPAAKRIRREVIAGGTYWEMVHQQMHLPNSDEAKVLLQKAHMLDNKLHFAWVGTPQI